MTEDLMTKIAEITTVLRQFNDQWKRPEGSA